MSRVSARLQAAAAATREAYGGRFVFYELLWPVTAARLNMSVAFLRGPEALVRCCDDVTRAELRATGAAPGTGVVHPLKGARGLCEGGGEAGG